MSLSLSDQLALSRTQLANERTFLAYFRSFIVMLSSGLAILHIEDLKGLQNLGYFLSFSAPIVLVIGLIRFFHTKRKIKRLEIYYHIEDEVID